MTGNTYVDRDGVECLYWRDPPERSAYVWSDLEQDYVLRKRCIS